METLSMREARTRAHAAKAADAAKAAEAAKAAKADTSKKPAPKANDPAPAAATKEA